MKELESTTIIAYMLLFPSEPHADLDRDTDECCMCYYEDRAFSLSIYSHISL